MFSTEWKGKLKRLPFARRTEEYFLKQGHTVKDAEAGALLVAALDLFVFIVLFNSFLAGIILSLPKTLSDFMRQNPAESVFGAIFLTLLVFSVIFKNMRASEEKKQEMLRQVRRSEMEVGRLRESVKSGAMASFESVYRTDLAKKYPGIEIQAIYITDTTPRIKFRMIRFTTESGGDVDANYRLFREKLFNDTWSLIRTAFEVAPNIPAVIVDAMFNFISRKAQFYDGSVLSVKATREIFRSLDTSGLDSFKILTAFDLRYNDGSEVEAHSEEESKSARLLEKIRRNGRKMEIRYETEKPVEDDGWQTASTPVAASVSSEVSVELSKIPFDRFQAVVMELLVRRGFDVQKMKKIPGGTLEVLARHPHPLLGGDFVALARQYPPEAQVHAELVTELDQLVRDEQCQRGIYLVTGRFTEEAANIARGMPVCLVDGRWLKELAKATPGEGAAVEKPAEVFAGITPGKAPDLNGISLTAFQDKVDETLKGLGFRVVKIRKMTDGAIFARVEDTHPLVGGVFAVLARQAPADSEVSAEVVRETARVMDSEFCRRGLLMATASFTAEARGVARSLAVELVDRGKWTRLFSGG